MKKHVARIGRDGTVTTLYTDKIALRKIGTMKVERASNVEFDNNRGGWTVQLADGRVLVELPPGGTFDAAFPEALIDRLSCRIAVFKTRDEALAAEVAFLQARL